MSRLLSRLVKWIRRGPVPQPVPAVPVAPDWTESDVEDWKRVIESPIGRKVVERAQAWHYAMMTAVTHDPKAIVERAHNAQGFADCTNWLISLGYARPVKVEQVNPDQDPAESAERAMLERYSP